MNQINEAGKDVLGRGVQGTVSLEGGYAVKEYFSGLSAEQATSLRNKRSAVVNADLPTYDTFEIDEENGVCRMTDLSEGKRNLVISTPDVLNTKQISQPELDLWMTIVKSRGGLQNLEDFLSTNRETIRKALNSNVFIKTSGYFLVVKPGGYAEMVIGDYDDGVLFEPNYELGDEEKRIVTSNYLNLLAYVVTKFFPSSTERIREEITTFNDLYHIGSPYIADFMAVLGEPK